MKIAFIGRLCSGKTSFAKHLEKNHNFHILSFGEPVKRYATEIFGLVDKNRAILQDFAQKVKEIDENVWIKYLINQLDSLENYNIVVDDLRFPNEYDALKQKGFYFIKLDINRLVQIERIKNTYTNYKIHIDRLDNISEQHVDDMIADYTIKIDDTSDIDISNTIKHIFTKLNK